MSAAPGPVVELTIIVVSYNTRELLAACLESVSKAARGLNYEIIVVDNASRDGSAEMVARQFPAAKLISNFDNQGFARANNQAIRASQGRYILLLNSDATLMPDAVQSMVRFMEAHPRVGVVGAQLLNPDGTFQASFADFPSFVGELLLLTKLAKLVYSPNYPSYPYEQSQDERAVDWVFGACIMVRRSAVDDVGPLDEDFFMYSEEADWCHRMRKRGWLVYYLPSAKVTHWWGQSASGEPERRRSQLYRSKYLYIRKHHGRLIARAFHLAVQTTSLAKLLLWAMVSVTPDHSKRERAMQQVRSYATLLSEF